MLVKLKKSFKKYKTKNKTKNRSIPGVLYGFEGKEIELIVRRDNSLTTIINGWYVDIDPLLIKKKHRTSIEWN